MKIVIVANFFFLVMITSKFAMANFVIPVKKHENSPCNIDDKSNSDVQKLVPFSSPKEVPRHFRHKVPSSHKQPAGNLHKTASPPKALTFNSKMVPNSPPKPQRLRGIGRLSPPIGSRFRSCSNNPRVCRAKDSRGGPDCCKNRCTNMLTDSFNCGACGKMCRYGQMCCNGKCVEILFNRENCGRCNRKCNDGDNCSFGLCNYANYAS